MDDFFRFSKKSGFGVFLVHPPMASVLLSASVERCFVSRMRDFLNIYFSYISEFVAIMALQYCHLLGAMTFFCRCQ